MSQEVLQVKLYIKPEGTASILITGRYQGKQTSRGFEVIGNDIVYKVKAIIEQLYKDLPSDPFNELELRTFQIRVDGIKISTRSTLTLNEYVTLFKEYIEFERWDL